MAKQTLKDALLSNVSTDPTQHALNNSESRWASFKYALAGFGYMFRWQKNIRILMLATPIIIFMGLWLEITRIEWAIVTSVIALVWITEFLNAGIEAAIDVAIGQQHHPMAKVGKDVSAGAVLLASVFSIIIGLLIFLEPLLKKLGF